MKRGYLHKVVLAIVCFLIMIYHYSPCIAKDYSKNTVKVAYFDLGSYYQEQEDGTVKCYDSVYLKQITKYTGLNFEYVNCGTWDNAINMLNNHEVDLLGTMPWTQEKKDAFEITDVNYGYTVSDLASKENSEYIYENYETMDGAIVGYIEGYVIADQLKELEQKNNISFEYKTYTTQKDLENAFEEGKIDLIATNAYAVHDDWKIVKKFDYAPYYFASWKGNSELINTISQAIIQINMYESNFDDDLLKEFFPIMLNSPYDKEEMDCIHEEKEYTIYFDNDAKPIMWYDDNSGIVSGILVDVCDRLSEITGLKFNIAQISQDEERNSDTDISYRILYYDNGKYDASKGGITDSILDLKFEMYHCHGEHYELNGTYSIGIVGNRDGLYNYVAEKYPSCTVVEYSSPEECVNAMLKGTVDLAFLNTYVADNVFIENDITDVLAIPMSEITFGIGLEFQGENAALLSGIVDKGIRLIDYNSINNELVKYIMDTTPKSTLKYVLKQHKNLVACVVVIIMCVVLVCVGLWIYTLMLKKERNRIEEIGKERTDFFARMSHDMRTPMNGILGMLELTEDSDDIEEIKRNTKKAIVSGKYMLSLINDTLDLQRIENKKLTFEPQFVYVRDFIDSIREMIQPSVEQKNINFIINNRNIVEDYYINIDPVRVKQIFINILSNAVKFTPENGTIEIVLENQIIVNNIATVRVVISDTGIGMSNEFLENNLFKPYSQEHNKITNSYAGSGLGLAIVKNLVEMMNGHIEVKSEPGEGTTFILDIDFEYIDKNIVQDDIKSKQNNIEEVMQRLSGKNILICEDHPLNAEIACRLLEKAGCRTTVAKDGSQGLKIFTDSENYEFDCILMDIRMPIMDGVEATIAIRKLDRKDAKSIPIIAMTANAYDSDKDKCKNAGMNAHLAKPVNVKELYNTIDKCIEEIYTFK